MTEILYFSKREFLIFRPVSLDDGIVIREKNRICNRIPIAYRVGAFVVFGELEAEMEDAESQTAGFVIDMQDCRNTCGRRCPYCGFTDRAIGVDWA
jgi:hypothetical protein